MFLNRSRGQPRTRKLVEIPIQFANDLHSEAFRTKPNRRAIDGELTASPTINKSTQNYFPFLEIWGLAYSFIRARNVYLTSLSAPDHLSLIFNKATIHKLTIISTFFSVKFYSQQTDCKSCSRNLRQMWLRASMNFAASEIELKS